MCISFVHFPHYFCGVFAFAHLPHVFIFHTASVRLLEQKSGHISSLLDIYIGTPLLPQTPKYLLSHLLQHLPVLNYIVVF